jgi:hypothetical protein
MGITAIIKIGCAYHTRDEGEAMTQDGIQEAREWSGKLMGWTWYHSLQEWICKGKNEPAPIGFKRDSGQELRQNPWHPDKDLNQTFMVVARMREVGWYGRILFNSNLDDPYIVIFFHKKSGETVKAEHINPAHAILKAAMAAVPEVE